MSTKKGFLQGYNAQAVANEDQVIVAASVTDCQNDIGQLHPMIEAIKTSLAEAGIEERPGTLLADAGYCSKENLAALDDYDPDVYVATRNIKRTPPRQPTGAGGSGRTRRSWSRWTVRSRTRPVAPFTGNASRSSNRSSHRSRTGATSAASCEEARRPPLRSGR